MRGSPPAFYVFKRPELAEFLESCGKNGVFLGASESAHVERYHAAEYGIYGENVINLLLKAAYVGWSRKHKFNRVQVIVRDRSHFLLIAVDFKPSRKGHRIASYYYIREDAVRAKLRSWELVPVTKKSTAPIAVPFDRPRRVASSRISSDAPCVATYLT